MPRIATPRSRPRKQPVQARSQRTVDAILEATARVLVARGWAGSTTNHVAAKAGVSIGTLYEYFPGKEALVTALVERHLDEATLVLERLALDLASRAGSMRPRELATSLVRAMVELHEDRPRLHRVLFDEVPHCAAIRARVRALEGQQSHLLAGLLRSMPGARVRDPDVSARMIVDLLEALTHRWVTDAAGAPLPRERLESELIELLASYLEARRAA